MTVKIEGLDAIVKKLESLGKPAVFKRPMRLAVDHIYHKMKVSPSKSGTWSAWAKGKPGVLAAYWAKVHSGAAKHGPGGYIRSGRLKRDWERRVEKGGRLGVIENKNTGGYAHWVQGESQISPHGDSKYPTTEDVAKKEARTVVRIFEDEYNRQLKK